MEPLELFDFSFGFRIERGKVPEFSLSLTHSQELKLDIGIIIVEHSTGFATNNWRGRVQ